MENKITIIDDESWNRLYNEIKLICSQSKMPISQLISILEFLKLELYSQALQAGEEEQE